MQLKCIFILGTILLINLFEENCMSQQALFIAERYREYIEQTYSENEDIYSEILEILEFYHENPININDTNIEELSNLTLLTEFQIQSLVSYISQNGPMVSVHELQLINGFSQQVIELILPFVCVRKNAKKKPFNLKQLKKYGKHSFILGYKTIIETQKGYTPISETDRSTTRYLGPSFRNYFKYEFQFQNNIKFRIAADKDPGEEFFSGSQKGFDFYSISLMLNDFSFMKKFALGNYDLQFGQGLTLWTGFGYGMPIEGNIKKEGQTIKLAGSFSEYGYLQGFASTLCYKKMYLTSFYSYTPRDASIVETDENGKVIKIQSILNTGYHRIETELDNKNAFTETILGSNIQYKSRYLHLGATMYKMSFSAILQPQSQLYNIHYFKGNENFNSGVDFKALIGKISLFGELSLSQNGAFAGLLGTYIPLTDNTSLGMLYRNYAVDYQNLHSLPIGQNSSHSNEKGILSTFQTILPLNIQMVAIADIFIFSWLRYQVNSPSYGKEYRINISKEIDKNINISFRYRYKNNLSNTSTENIPIVFTEEHIKQSFQFNLSYQEVTSWTFNSRVKYNIKNTESGTKTKGFLIYQDIIFSPENLFFNFALRYALFDAEEYDNRLYAYERDFLYESSSAVYNHKGSRFYLIMNLKLRKNYSLGLRYSIWYFPELESIGSSLEEIKGNTKQEIKMQLRIKF